MNAESQSPQVDQEALFNKFFNEDLTPDQVASTEAPDAMSAVPKADEPVVAGSEAAVPAEESKTPEAAAVTPPSQSPDPNEWLAKLPEDVRGVVEQQFKQAQYWQNKHQELASKNRKLYNEVSTLQKKVTPPPVTDVRNSEEVDEDWKKLEEADPVLAKILKKREEAIAAKFEKQADEKARQYVEPIQEREQQQYVAYQQDILTNEIPNWREVVQDPYFKAWKDQASEGVKALYASLDARDSVRVLQLYASDMQSYFGQSQAPAQQVAPVVAQQSNPEVAKVTQQRQDKLAKSAPIQSHPVGQARSAQLTQEQLFAKLYDNPDAIRELIATNRS